MKIQKKIKDQRSKIEDQINYKIYSQNRELFEYIEDSAGFLRVFDVAKRYAHQPSASSASHHSPKLRPIIQGDEKLRESSFVMLPNQIGKIVEMRVENNQISEINPDNFCKEHVFIVRRSDKNLADAKN